MSDRQNTGYDAFYLTRNKQDARRRQRQLRDYQRRFAQLLEGSRERSVLDIGCADGRLAAYLRHEGFTEVVGVDLNETLIEKARAEVDAEFTVADGMDILQSERRFDVIFMLNVLEHLDRPRLVPFMQACCKTLNEGGFVVLRTPNMNSLLAAGHLADDITHCVGLTEQSLAQLATMAGFSRTKLLDQFAMSTTNGKVKICLNWPVHRLLFWLRGGSRPRVYSRNLYAQLFR